MKKWYDEKEEKKRTHEKEKMKHEKKEKKRYGVIEYDAMLQKSWE